MYWKLGLLAGLIGLLGVGLLLFGAHPGVAIRVTNWLFPVLFISILVGLLKTKE